MAVDQQSRGTKRSADAASQDDQQDSVDDDGDENRDPTPRKKGSSAKHTKFHVVVTSPEHKRPKQRHTMDVDDGVEVGPVAEVDEVEEPMEMDASAAMAPEKPWVATGAVSQYILHFHVY
jgi:hypothetical protein